MLINILTFRSTDDILEEALADIDAGAILESILREKAIERMFMPIQPLPDDIIKEASPNATLREWARRPSAAPPDEWWDDPKVAAAAEFYKRSWKAN